MAAARHEQKLQESLKTLRQGGKRAKLEAIHSLGRLADPRGIPALVGALASKDADIRVRAIGKLVFLNHAGIIPDLVKALDDKEPRVRQHALYALQRLKARAAADRIAQVLVSDKDDMARFNAALALAAVGTRKHIPAFVRVLDDRSNNVLLTALGALARLAPRQASSYVLRLVRNTKRWAAVPQGQRDVTLGLLRGSLRKKEVVALLRKIVNDGIREAERAGRPPMTMEMMEAARLLAEAGDGTGVPVLLEALKGGEYSQEKAVAALAALKHKAAVPRIIETALQNGFFPIKLKTIKALGEIGDARALAVLASVFNDRVDDFTMDRTHVITKDDPDIRLTALAAMAAIVRENVRAAARSADPFERRRARELLGAC